MESSTATKKKKRRTRKCLDEIRNRSRRTMRGEGDSGQTSQREKKNRADEGQVTRLITTNRLTLNMFPKAIRSETITRPILKEINQKSNSNFQNVDINDLNSLSKPLEVECLEQSNSASKNSMPMFDLEEDSLQEQVKDHSDNQMRNSLNSHSPIHEHYMAQTPAAELIANVQSTTSLSSQTSDGDNGQELYDEVMNKISSHLKKVTSALVVDDTLKKTKVNLQKLYIKSWSKEFNINMEEHKQSSQITAALHSRKDSIVQNPLDYIRLSTSHEQQQGLCSPCPSQPLSAVPSPAVTTRECTPHSAFYRTPEYNYYPHRLN